MSESSLQLIAFILIVLIAVLFLMAKRMDEMDADEHEDVGDRHG